MKATTIDDRFRELVREIVQEVLSERAQREGEPSNLVEQLTVAEYASRWSISQSTVRAAIRERRLEHTRIGTAIRIAAGARISSATTTIDAATARARRRLGIEPERDAR